MRKWFSGLPLIVRVLLLLIPVVNLIIELLIRIEDLFKKVTLKNVLLLIVIVIFSAVYVVEIIDIICLLLTGHLFGLSKSKKRK